MVTPNKLSSQKDSKKKVTNPTGKGGIKKGEARNPTGKGGIKPGEVRNPSGRAPLPVDVRELRKQGTEEMIRSYAQISAVDRIESFTPNNPVQQLMQSVWIRSIQEGTTGEMDRIWNRVLGKPLPVDDDGKTVPVAIVLEDMTGLE